MKTEERAELKEIFLSTVPVLSGYMVLGIGFGVLLRAKGYGVLWALLISTLIYAGSLQFVLIGLISSGAGILETALTALMINSRHIFYGISMVDKYGNTGPVKPYLIFSLTDETYALVCNEQTVNRFSDKKRFYLLVSLMNQFYWVAGSVFGSLIGSIIPFNTRGLDFALTALFITVFTDQWMSAKNHIPALAGIGASVVCLLIFGAGRFLIPAMILIIIILAALRGKADYEYN